nr:DNA polymerase I family protein [Rubrobacter sp.]
MSRNTKRISHKLVDVTRRELGISMDKEHQASDWSGDLTPEMLSYASKDSEVLLPLARTLEAGIEGAGLQRVADIERRALP